MHPLDSAWAAVKEEFDSACSQSARAARWELTNDLNQLLRRLRQYHGEGEWISILVEGLTRFVPQAAIFEVTSSNALRLRGQTGMNLPGDLTFPTASGAAFLSVISSRDPAVAMRTPAEVSEALALSEAGEVPRCHVIPIVNGDRVAAVLFAAGAEYVDINALELIGGVASVILERSANRQSHLQVAVPPPASKPVPSKPALPAWSDLPDQVRTKHVQAQRFARVTVAELQLAHPDACRSGRSESNLYLYLKRDLDKARDNFRKNYMETPSMVDYLHMELVNTAVAGDESKLGAEYPGPLA